MLWTVSRAMAIPWDRMARWNFSTLNRDPALARRRLDNQRRPATLLTW